MNTSPLHDQYADHDWVPLGEGHMALRLSEPEAEVRAGVESAALFDLSAVGLIELEGADTARFCNSQFTNNIRDLKPGEVSLNALTDNKGRVRGLASILMLREDCALVVLDPGTDREFVHDRLDMYIIMDPIELRDRSLELGVLTLQGPKAEALASSAGLGLVDSAHREVEGVRVCRIDRLGQGGVDFIAPRSTLPALWARLSAAGAVPAGFEAYESLRVRAGIPRWPRDIGDKNFVHELGLRDRVSCFTKGCYMGQEVINRMETMGKINRRLTQVRLDEPVETPAPVSIDGKSVGAITTIGRFGDQVVGMGLLRASAWPEGTPLRVGVEGRTVDGSTSTFSSAAQIVS